MSLGQCDSIFLKDSDIHVVFIHEPQNLKDVSLIPLQLRSFMMFRCELILLAMKSMALFAAEGYGVGINMNIHFTIRGHHFLL